MNDTIKAIEARCSVRAYTDEPVSKEDIEQVIEAGIWAASGANAQSSIVVAVTNKELRDRLSAMNAAVAGMPADKDPFYGAPVVLVVLDKADAPTPVYDGSLCIGNMLLAASSMGLGACWIHRAKEEFASDEGKAILADLGIEGDYVGVGHCILGHPAQPGTPKARKENRVFWAE